MGVAAGTRSRVEFGVGTGRPGAVVSRCPGASMFAFGDQLELSRCRSKMECWCPCFAVLLGSRPVQLCSEGVCDPHWARAAVTVPPPLWFL